MHVLVSFIVFDLIKYIITNTIFDFSAFLNMKSWYTGCVLAIYDGSKGFSFLSRDWI